MENLETHHHIKTYGRRASRLSASQLRYYQLRDNTHYGNTYYFNNPATLHDVVFKHCDSPPILEIGSGMGHATIHYALHHSSKNIVACEVYHAGIAMLLHAIAAYQLTNLYIFEGDIHDIQSYSKSTTAVSGVHIFFPDPWPKIRHRKRRLISHDFMKWLYTITIPYGYCAIATDFKDYASDVYKYATAVGFRPYSLHYPPLYTRWRTQTNYEKKAISSQRICYNHIFYKPLTL